MDQTQEFITQISRSSIDYFPSVYEIFYKHFLELPLFVYQTGITDRYSDPSYSDDDDSEEDISLPHEGMRHLSKEVTALKKYLENSKSYKKTEITEYLYANHESNTFISILVLNGERTVLQFRISPSRRRTLTSFMIFADTYDKKGIDELKEYAKQFIAPPPTKKDKIHIITQSSSDFYLRDIPLQNKKSQFSFENYNEEFEGVSERIVNALKHDNESGLVLFHGDPGTGKTSYLKHLLRIIDNKKLIYMPPDLTEHLSSPGFVTFMMAEAMNSVLLIEDAENVLRHREAGGNQAVSNILNLSDGILGDVLKLQMVCTFNSRLEDIDPALLRPGRCIAEYRFEKLAADRAANLMRKLHGNDVEFEEKAMTLADIFNFKKPKDRTKQRKGGLGFTADL